MHDVRMPFQSQVRAELRQLATGLQVWVGADSSAGLLGVRELVDRLVESDEDRVLLSSVPGLTMSDLVEVRLERVDGTRRVRPVLLVDGVDGYWCWFGTREDWRMCRDLIDGVMEGGDAGFQWLTGGDDDAEVVIERLS